MPVLKRTTPCNGCPWRRESAPGWLGADTPEGFLATTMAEVHMPCHVVVNYERADWREQAETAPFCAGALIFLRNTCKLPNDPTLRSARGSVQPDHKTVFSHGQQFLDHHAGR